MAPLQRLLSTLEPPPTPAFAEHEAASCALQTLCRDIEPAARRLLGDSEGTAWLAPLWHQLGQRSEGLAFRPEHAEVQAAPLYRRAGDVEAAADVAARIESWRRIPRRWPG